MTVLSAWIDGWRRVLRAPSLVAGLWLATVLLALPLALTLREMLSEHLGASLAAGPAAAGVNFDWWNEFLSQAAGLGQTFVPSILGFAAVVRNLGTMADARALPTVVASVVTAHLVVSTFLLGGVLDRLARDRAIGSHGFFAACGVYVFRFLRLAALAGAAYWLLFVHLHPLLFETLFARITEDLTVERVAFAYRVALYAFFGALVVAVNVLVDYAKIRIVVEDRRSAIGAVAAAWRFIARQPLAVAGLYALNALLFAAALAGYALVAGGVGGGMSAVLALVAGQLYIVLRVLVRLLFAASQIALFQGRLAHAGYTARPLPSWPDSPAADAIRPQ